MLHSNAYFDRHHCRITRCHGADARTLMRAWSERLNSPAVHANEYYKSQPARLREVGQSLYDYFSTFRACRCGEPPMPAAIDC